MNDNSMRSGEGGVLNNARDTIRATAADLASQAKEKADEQIDSKLGMARTEINGIASALRRDVRIIRLGASGAARPPVFTMISMGCVCTISALALILNVFSLLPGPRQAWYVTGVCALFLFAIVPLVHLVAAVRQEE